MAGPLVANNISTVLAGAVGPSDVLLVVASDAGMPLPGAGEYFFLTLEDASNNVEVVRCTSRVGTTLTVLRAQDGTTAKSFGAGDFVELRPNAQLLRDLDWRGARGAADGVAGLDSGSKVPVAQLPVGTASGVAGLDSNSKVPAAQLPVGAANGVAGLDSNSKVPVAQLPVGVADGIAGLDSNSKVPEAQLPAAAINAVDSVNGKTGAVVLNATDVSAIPTSQKAAASGVAPLDADSRLPVTHAPVAAEITFSSSRNAAITDHARMLRGTSGSAHTLTIPDTLPDGFYCGVIQGAGGQITIAVSGSLTLHGRRGVKTAAQHSVIGVSRVGSLVYVYGDTTT